MSFCRLLLRTQELNFIALPVRAGPFVGIILSMHKLLHPGLPEILLPFRKGNKPPYASCFELLLSLRCPGSESHTSAQGTEHRLEMLHPCCCGHKAP